MAADHMSKPTNLLEQRAAAFELLSLATAGAPRQPGDSLSAFADAANRLVSVHLDREITAGEGEGMDMALGAAAVVLAERSGLLVAMMSVRHRVSFRGLAMSELERAARAFTNAAQVLQ